MKKIFLFIAVGHWVFYLPAMEDNYSQEISDEAIERFNSILGENFYSSNCKPVPSNAIGMGQLYYPIVISGNYENGDVTFNLRKLSNKNRNFLTEEEIVENICLKVYNRSHPDYVSGKLSEDQNFLDPKIVNDAVSKLRERGGLLYFMHANDILEVVVNGVELFFGQQNFSENDIILLQEYDVTVHLRKVEKEKAHIFKHILEVELNKKT